MSALSYLVLKSSSADLSEHSRVSYFVLETNTTTGRGVFEKIILECSERGVESNFILKCASEVTETF